MNFITKIKWLKLHQRLITKKDIGWIVLEEFGLEVFCELLPGNTLNNFDNLIS